MPEQPAKNQATPVPTTQSKLPWYKNPVNITVALILVILYVSGNVWVYFKYFVNPKNEKGNTGIFSQLNPFKDNASKTASKPAPTPAVYVKPKPIATGKQEFVVSGGEKTGPRFSKLIVNPLNPKKDEVQTVDVYVTDTTDVKSVTLSVKTDKKTTPNQLKLKEGDAKKGVWSGSWKIDDTYDLSYMYIIEAESAGGKNKVEPIFR